MKVSLLRMACPNCHTPLESRGEDLLVCPGEGREYLCERGIWRCLLPERAQYYARFLEEYEIVRQAEGRGSSEPQYYRALPFEDLSGRSRADWRIRARSFTTFVEQVRVMVRRAEPPDYDSLEALGGWQDLPLLTALTFQHDLNWAPYLQLVRVECKSDDFPGPGIHQVYAGGNHDWFIGWQGAYIENVERNQVDVRRLVNDPAFQCALLLPGRR